MNQRIFNPPLAKAGEPTPADAQATATVRIPNVSATGNQLSNLIRNLNELETDDAEINTRIELARAKLEELKDLIRTDPLSAAAQDKGRDRERIDTENTEDEAGAPEYIPAIHTIPTIVWAYGGIVMGWAEVTYGKIKKPENYTAHEDDIYQIYVRLFYDFAFFNLTHTKISGHWEPHIEEIGKSFPVPSSSYPYLGSFTRSRRSDEYWNGWNGTILGGQFPNYYTESFDPEGARPGSNKTVNISMKLRGWQYAERKNIGESEDTAVYVETTMRPAGWNPIDTVWGADPLHPGSPHEVNQYAYNAEYVIFCTAQDLIEWNELYKAHPDELYEIPLID